MTQISAESKNAFHKLYGSEEQRPLELNENDKFTVFFDANILLGLIEYGDETRNNIFEILENEKLAPRLKITYHVGLEFYNAFEAVFDRSRKKKIDLANKIKTILDDVKKYRQKNSMELSEELRERFDEYERTSDEISVTIERAGQSRSRDFEEYKKQILDRISNLFSEKILNKLSDADIQSIKYSGQYRFEYKIPPGFKDSGKGEMSQFGDFIIWQEIINYCTACSSESPDIVIFVTDDAKVDWWDKANNPSEGARNARRNNFPNAVVQNTKPNGKLIREFKYITGKDIIIVKMDDFIEMISNFIGIEKNSDLLQIVRDESITSDGKDAGGVNGPQAESLSSGTVLDPSIEASDNPVKKDLKSEIEAYISKINSYTHILEIFVERNKKNDDSSDRHFYNLSIIMATYAYMEYYNSKGFDRLRNAKLKTILREIEKGQSFDFESFENENIKAEKLAVEFIKAVKDELKQMKRK